MENKKKFNRLEYLDLSNVEVFYSQVKNAVEFAENNNRLSEEDRHRMLETFGIMAGSNNPLSEEEKVIALARRYGFIEQVDLVTLIKNDKTAAFFLQS